MSSLFFPLVSFLMQVVVMAWFVITAIYLASSGTQEFSWASRNETNTTEFCPEDTLGKTCEEGEINTVADCECVFVKYCLLFHEKCVKRLYFQGLEQMISTIISSSIISSHCSGASALSPLWEKWCWPEHSPHGTGSLTSLMCPPSQFSTASGEH